MVERRERGSIEVGGQQYAIYRLGDVVADLGSLPYTVKVLLENLMRHQDGDRVTADDVDALASWTPGAGPRRELAFSPARVLMQDFTGVPAIVDLAAMRDAMAELGGDPARINPLVPVDLVIDHSVIADVYGTPDAFQRNAELEFRRNRERYQFLRWGAEVFDGLRVVPPETGICHQVNLEYLSRVVQVRDGVAFPDSLVGTDSHTPMVNGLGVLGWGVGGIEAEAAMLGEPLSLLTPEVVGLHLSGEMPEGSTATDLVLTVAELLRRHGVVGRFVEFFGPGVAAVALENRATLGNMSPEYGSTSTVFPIDEETLRYLRFTGRPDDLVALVEAYAKEQGLWHDESTPTPRFSSVVELDLSTVVPSLAGPKRPQDRVPLDRAAEMFASALDRIKGRAEARPMGCAERASDLSFPASDPPASMAGTTTCDEGTEEPAASAPPSGEPLAAAQVRLADGTEFELDDGHVVIAAITSCTNTSNPSVMIAAGLLARNAVGRGLTSKPWVKTSLAPGSRVVMDYYERAGLTPYLEKLGFDLVGFGCTTCIGNSGPLLPEISAAINDHDLAVCSTLSGNRNFEGRIHADCRMNYLMSPPLVVAYALAGTMTWDPYHDPIGTDSEGKDVFLRDLWPSSEEITAAVRDAVRPDMFADAYADVFTGDDRWRSLEVTGGNTYAWDAHSTYVRQPPFFEGLTADPAPLTDVDGARVLAFLGDSVTTDHISPAGTIPPSLPAGAWLIDQGVEPKDFNSYGSRRGNHEVMMRGTFANIRLRNRLVPDVEGGFTRHLPGGEQLSIYDAAMRYRDDGVPLVILAGKEYGSGSSRDWAAKGTALLGVRAVIAESYERIHRANLIDLGVLPLQFPEGESADSLGLTGEETFTITGIAGITPGAAPATVRVRAGEVSFDAPVRLDTAAEVEYYRHGGILPYVLRRLASD